MEARLAKLADAAWKTLLALIFCIGVYHAANATFDFVDGLTQPERHISIYWEWVDGQIYDPGLYRYLVLDDEDTCYLYVGESGNVALDCIEGDN